jgi:hypothetical protein
VCRTRKFILLVALLAAGCTPAGFTGPAGGPAPAGGPVSGGRAPVFDYAEGGGGCADLQLFSPNQDKSEVLVVWADADRLGIQEGVTTFDLSKASEHLTVTVNVYRRPQKHLHTCQDFTDPESDEPVVWTAVRGTLTVERFPRDKAEGGNRIYRARVKLENAEFREPGGRTAVCPHPVTMEATVGWYPG